MAGSKSVGLLLFRRTGVAGVELLIAKMGGPFWERKSDHSWTVPKGLVEEGDDGDLSVAEREFAEEMGFRPPAGDSLDLGSTKSGSKTICVFAREGDADATAVESNTFEMEWPPRSGQVQEFPEVARAEWVEPERATKLLAKSQAVFVERLLDKLEISR